MAARRRINGESSAGAATTTERARPSSPRMSSMNSLTSRPRSPINPTTVMSASVNRVIIPSSILLPTPLPANRPRRCPCPTVSNALIARIPTSMDWRTGARFNGLMMSPVSCTLASACNGPLPSSGSPAPFTTRPSICGPTGTLLAEARGITRAPGLRPSMAVSGIR